MHFHVQDDFKILCHCCLAITLRLLSVSLLCVQAPLFIMAIYPLVCPSTSFYYWLYSLLCVPTPIFIGYFHSCAFQHHFLLLAISLAVRLAPLFSDKKSWRHYHVRALPNCAGMRCPQISVLVIQGEFCW